MTLSNKSRLATLGIAAAASLLAWRNAQRQHAADLDTQRLEADCREAGLDPAAIAASTPASVLAKKSARSPAPATAACDPHTAAAQLAACVLAERTTPAEDAARYTAMMELLASIQPAQLEVMFADLRANPALDQGHSLDEAFSQLLFSVGSHKPREVLDLLEKNPAIFTTGKPGSPDYVAYATNDCIWSLSCSDPAATLDWVRSHTGGDGKIQPELDQYARSGILQGIARTDPAQAFSLIGQLGLFSSADDSWVMSSIARVATDPAEKTAMLTAARDYAAQLQDPAAKQQAVGSLTAELARGEIDKGFATGSAWIDANLTPEETAGMIGHLANSTILSDCGQWLEWMGDKLPPADLQRKTGGILRNWADYDYAAAANWLDTTAPGPAREAAILSFAPAAAAYQPAAAANWAITLPPGPGRDRTLNMIYGQWRTSDPASADRFAQEHP